MQLVKQLNLKTLLTGLRMNPIVAKPLIKSAQNNLQRWSMNLPTWSMLKRSWVAKNSQQAVMTLLLLRLLQVGPKVAVVTIQALNSSSPLTSHQQHRLTASHLFSQHVSPTLMMQPQSKSMSFRSQIGLQWLNLSSSYTRGKTWMALHSMKPMATRHLPIPRWTRLLGLKLKKTFQKMAITCLLSVKIPK